MNQLDARQYALDRIRQLKKEFVWSEGVDADWKSNLCSRLKKVIGLSTERVALEPEETDQVHLGDYSRTTVTFASRSGMRVFGYLLIPDEVKTPAPAVICVPGHGNGVDCIVGIESDDYQNDFAIQCVRAGFVTLAIEPIGFGLRKAEVDRERYSSCNGDSMAALMLGESMIGWRVHDALVAIDYLLTRPEVDQDRIATMGISGGGLVAFWAACLDERIAATVVSGYFNTFFDSILSIDHCVDNYAHGLAKVVEMPDMAALIAPRPLFVESGAKDHIFPLAAFELACKRAEAIFRHANEPENFGCHVFDGGHEFNGTQAIPRLKTWLSNPE